MRRVATALMGLVAAGLVPAAMGATCTDRWEYRVIDTTNAGALRRRAALRSDAVTGLEQTLNRLGEAGWRLATEHRLVIRAEEDADGKRSGTVVSLDPPSALLMRRVETCQ